MPLQTQDASMDRQLYAPGQIVSVAPDSLSGPRTAGFFRVVRGYPVRGLARIYHVNSVRDRGQRMVPENELSAQMVDNTAIPAKVICLFPETRPFNAAKP